jgi:putative colanic acid biosynthesis acetyltransferase WcaF
MAPPTAPAPTPPAGHAIFQTLDRCSPAPYARGEYVRKFLWTTFQFTLFRIPIKRLWGFRRFLLRCFGARLARRVGVHPTTRVVHPWLLEMDDWTMIGPGCTVYNLGPVTIGSHSVISQDVYLCAGTHDYTKPDLPLLRPPIRIGSGVWIAAGAFVGPGVTIGDNSVIGARAVVTSDVPAGVVAAGNPCRVIKPRPMDASAS